MFRVLVLGGLFYVVLSISDVECKNYVFLVQVQGFPVKALNADGLKELSPKPLNPKYKPSKLPGNKQVCLVLSRAWGNGL